MELLKLLKKENTSESTLLTFRIGPFSCSWASRHWFSLIFCTSSQKQSTKKRKKPKSAKMTCFYSKKWNRVEKFKLFLQKSYTRKNIDLFHYCKNCRVFFEFFIWNFRKKSKPKISKFLIAAFFRWILPNTRIICFELVQYSTAYTKICLMSDRQF